MSDNALCTYCDADGSIDPAKGGDYEGLLAPLWTMLKSLLSTLADILSDVVLFFFCGVLEGMLFIAGFLKIPEIAFSLQNVISDLSPTIGYVLAKTGFAPALVIIGGGYAFYMLRRLATLGNW